MIITSHLQWKSQSKWEALCRGSLLRGEISHRLPEVCKAFGKTNETGEGRIDRDMTHDMTQIGNKNTD